jgi:hypothetical protein
MQDLSSLAKDSMWVTSQAGGNMLASSEKAMTAPGSQPVDNLDDHQSAVHEDPTVEDSNAEQITPGTSGKPQASGQQGSHARSRAAWGPVTVPEVVRKPAADVPRKQAE